MISPNIDLAMLDNGYYRAETKKSEFVMLYVKDGLIRGCTGQLNKAWNGLNSLGANKLFNCIDSSFHIPLV